MERMTGLLWLQPTSFQNWKLRIEYLLPDGYSGKEGKGERWTFGRNGQYEEGAIQGGYVIGQALRY